MNWSVATINGFILSPPKAKCTLHCRRTDTKCFRFLFASIMLHRNGWNAFVLRKICVELERDEIQVFQVLTPRSLSINWLNFFRLVKNHPTGDAIRRGPDRWWLGYGSTAKSFSLCSYPQNNLFSPFHFFSPFRFLRCRKDLRGLVHEHRHSRAIDLKFNVFQWFTTWWPLEVYNRINLEINTRW